MNWLRCDTVCAKITFMTEFFCKLICYVLYAA